LRAVATQQASALLLLLLLGPALHSLLLKARLLHRALAAGSQAQANRLPKPHQQQQQGAGGRVPVQSSLCQVQACLQLCRPSSWSQTRQDLQQWEL
jgi:hypothetical protein